MPCVDNYVLKFLRICAFLSKFVKKNLFDKYLVVYLEDGVEI